MSSRSPASILYTESGVHLAVQDNSLATTSGLSGFIAAGSDGSNIQFLRVDSTGAIRVDPIGTTAQPITDNDSSITIDGNVYTLQSGIWNINNISGTISLPTGAATAALQTQPGVDIGDVTVNNASGASAVNIQDGGNSITVDGTVAISGSVAVTGPLTDAQLRAAPVPISGTVTANIGTTNGLALDATLTGGTQKAIARGGAKGATTAADVTSTAQSADRQALDVQIRTSTGVVVDTFGGGTQFADGAARGTATGTLAMGDDGTNIQSVKVDTAGVLAIQDNGGSITVDAASLPLPTGAATETTLAAINTKTPSLGQTTMASSSPVTIASNQTALPVTDNAGSLTVDAVSWPLPTGAATAALQTQPGVDIGDVTINNAAGASAVNIQDGGNSLTVDSPQLPAALVGGRLDGNTGAWLGSTAPTVGQKTMASSVPVVLASDQSALPVSIGGSLSSTGTQTSVASSASNVTLLASNASRKGATIYNDSNKTLYVKFGATASTTSFAVQLGAGSYMEVPFGYTGIIDGIWTSVNGSARITEFT
jgi:hypothetical protein